MDSSDLKMHVVFMAVFVYTVKYKLDKMNVTFENDYIFIFWPNGHLKTTLDTCKIML